MRRGSVNIERKEVVVRKYFVGKFFGNYGVDPQKEETTTTVNDASHKGRGQIIAYTKTIQSAINKAVSGSTIKISQGVYRERLTIRH